jgi:hypothetical protein
VIHLIGVEHSVQSIAIGAKETADQTRYRCCLEEAIERYRPLVVAEEYSEDALNRATYLHGPQEFFTGKIAARLGVKHRLCDTSIKAKCLLGCQTAAGWKKLLPRRLEGHDDLAGHACLPEGLEVVKDFPLRENYWLEQLNDVLHEEVVFVSGDYHVDTFGARLESIGVKSAVVARQIGMEAELIDQNRKVREYVGRHALLIEGVYQTLLQLNGGKIRSPFCLDGEDDPVAPGAS